MVRLAKKFFLTIQTIPKLFFVGEGYLNILRNLDNNYLENLPLAEHRQIFYQHDGAPPHNGHLVNTFLQEIFHDQWISNNGPFLWPPRSPDLSVLDYFIWGTIKKSSL